MKAHESYPANKQTWIKASDSLDTPTPHSGGEGKQLKGHDARNRVIAGPNGVNRTPYIIASPGSHVPQEKKPVVSQFGKIPKSGSKAWSKPF